MLDALQAEHTAEFLPVSNVEARIVKTGMGRIVRILRRPRRISLSKDRPQCQSSPKTGFSEPRSGEEFHGMLVRHDE